jgi:O-succinylbenzoate synthase
VEAVRDALGPAGQVRVDANGGWDVDTAVRMIRLLDRFALEYVEQPCRTVEELAAVRRRVDVPIAADESIRRAEDPLRVARLAAADIAVLKVQPLGGVAACLRIAEQIGLPVVVSSALEILGRHRRGDRAGRRPARAALRLRAGDAAAAGTVT